MTLYTSVLIPIHIVFILYMFYVYRHYPQILLRGASVVWVRRSPPLAHASTTPHIQRLPHRSHHSDRTNLTSKAPDKPSHSLSSVPSASVPSFSSTLAVYTQQTRSSNISSSSSSSSKVKQS